jgi:tRNA threonylcarbamoyladenosine biosynthesis protein TsaE
VSAAPGAEAGTARARTGSATATEALGEALAPALEVGDVVVLSGPLGAGKTRLVAGLARGLGCAARVRSPSFTLINEYRGRIPLVHLDLYRLESADAEGLGLEEQLERGAIVAEWGEKLPAWLRAEALSIEFEIGAGDERRLAARAAGGRGAALLAAFGAAAGRGAA